MERIQLSLPNAKRIRSSGDPYVAVNPENKEDTAGHVGCDGYLRCSGAQRTGEAKDWPSQKERDVYPVPTAMGLPIPVQPEPAGGAPSSAEEPWSLGGSSRSAAR